jgi:hypothetical protein
MNLLAFADHAARNDRMLLFLSVPITLLLTLRLLIGLRLARGTTLLIPWSWALACQLVFSACVILGQTFSTVSQTSDFAAWHFVAACGTFCPFVAMVGAKRPQHVAWNFVVLTLWGLLALPAAEVIFLQPGQQLEINSFRSWFLVALLVAEWVNFGFTRYWFSTLWLIAGQAILLWPYLPWGRLTMLASVAEIDRATIGGLLLANAYFFAFMTARDWKGSGRGLDRLWFDFRDSFGLFWALRLMERVNDTAQQAGWDFDLGWGGFRTKQDFAPLGELPAEIERPLRHTLTGLLRRFVSEDWIAQRMDQKSNTNEFDAEITS